MMNPTRVLLCGATAVTLAAALASVAADAPKKKAPVDPKKPWLTPLDPSVAKLPMDSQPLSPEASLKTIKVPDGYEVELIAAEPLVLDPVALNWGPDGRVWVVEMADYPLGMDSHGKPGSRVRWLSDTDGDGKLDKSVVFADGLNFANSVMAWRKGILVTTAPEIIYLEDTDGDGKADLRKVLYNGFDEGNPQLRINGLRPGLDNWIYCANGLSGKSEVRSTTTTDRIASLSGRDFRIKPDSGNLDAQAGATEFVRAMSNDGEWFGNDNSNPLWHFVIADHYVRRNPHVAAPDMKVQLVTPRNPTIFPISKLQQRFNVDYMANRITSACGIEVYRDELLFPAGALQGFTPEPVHNMVMRTVVEPSGVTYTGRRADSEKRSEFIAAEDRWFRPVFARTGPEGALWLADMYRYTVEHPQYMTEEWRSKLELRAGDDRGRLYRIVPKGSRLPLTVRLDNLSTTDLVARLESTNGQLRETVQQMLIWKADPAAVSPLESLARSSRNPHARLHALCTLDGMNALSDELLAAAMRDGYWAVRANAIRIAEPRGDKSPSVLEAALKLVDDAEPKVRMQLACSIGEWSGEQAGKALGKLAVSDSDDAYIVAAVMSSAVKHHATLVSSILAAGKASGEMLENLLEMSAALNNRAATAQLLDRVFTPDNGIYAGWQLEAFAGWIDTLPRQKTSLAKLAAGGDELSRQIGRVGEILAASRKVAVDASRPAADRIAAVRLLTREAGKEPGDVKIAATLFTPQTPSGVQLAAVNSIGRVPKVDHVEILLAAWDSLGPDVRFAITDYLLRNVDYTRRVLQLAADGKLAGFDVDYVRKQRLLKHKDPQIAALARKALGASSEGRGKVVKEWESVTTMQGDAKRGEAVYARACAICHLIGNVGREIGPDLRSVTDRSPGGLLTAIVDPNFDIDPKYYAYLVTTTNGEAYMGVLTNETGNSITILGMDGTPRTILRQNLASLRSTGRSLMPEGLEAATTKQEMADLIRYLGYPE